MEDVDRRSCEVCELKKGREKKRRLRQEKRNEDEVLSLIVEQGQRGVSSSREK